MTYKTHKMIAVVMAAGAVATASAQQPPGTATAERRAAVEREMQATLVAGRTRTPLESRITRGAPYSGEATTEFSQILPDGNRISRKSVTRTYRDSEGRTRREQVTTDATGAETVRITIVDPVARMTAVLDPQKREAARLAGVYSVAIAPVAPPSAPGVARGGGRGGRGRVTAAPTPTGPDAATRRVIETRAAAEYKAAGDDENVTTETLGQQMIEGVLADGKRTTRILPAGAVGNLQPIKIVSEEWFSPDLQVLVMTRHSDPRTGETTYRLTNIIRAEQDRSMFEIPPDYTVKEQGRR
jgi:hypothetical protein